MTDVNANSETTFFNIPTPADVLGRFSYFADTAIRVAAGLILMPHGAKKLFGLFGGYGLEATGQYFSTQLGFANGFLAALSAGSIEFFGGLLLAIGLFTRTSALIVGTFLLIAMTFHTGAGFFWIDGGIEYPLLWGLVALGYVLKGGGAYSLDNKFGLKF